MKQPNRRNPAPRGRPPLDEAAIEALAVRYAARYLTTRAKLEAYLRRKLAERGGPEDAEVVIAHVVAKAAAAGFVDDQAFAAARAASHARRGLGAARLRTSLRAAGVKAGDAAPVVAQAEDEAWEAVLALARRRRLGPFGPATTDPKVQRRAFGVLVRAGHPPALAGRLLRLPAEEAEG